MTLRARTALAAAALLLGGCETMSSWFPQLSSIPPPWQWFSFGSSKKMAPLPPFDAKATPRVYWQVALGGKEGSGFTPVVGNDAVVAAGVDGSIVSVDPASGRPKWSIRAGRNLSAGVGASSDLVVVGTDKADVLAFDAVGKSLWQTKISSEVAGPPVVAEGLAIAWSIDGKIFALSGADGKPKWVYQRTNPPLTVRRVAGGVVSRGGLFTGTAGGKLLALDLATGALGWEASVATPKGATELERIADVTSLPVVEERQVCAAAYQGRVACFEIVRGTLVWSRDFSSLAGITVDNRYLFLTDDKGAVHALDKTTGASVWKQDKLVGRFPSGPVLVGDYVGIVDGEGYLHLLDRNDGALVGRVATDGTGAESQPAASGSAAVWQSTAGNLISAGAS
ncbi:MAG: outer membrane protein assembly factor BamB [Betaproteobacteria bacterium]|nr:MAG: outer membrane protein assembly factor BamB [Betaproteobacteria bacterium]